MTRSKHKATRIAKNGMPLWMNMGKLKTQADDQQYLHSIARKTKVKCGRVKVALNPLEGHAELHVRTPRG